MSIIGTRAEIHLDAIAHNLQELRRITSPESSIMAVVKADGYGHGAMEIAKTALNKGATALGVARLNEGIKLRESGIDKPILIFGYTPPNDTDKLLYYNLTQTIGYPELAELYSHAAGKQGAALKVHLKIDSGMGRLGFLIDPLSAENQENMYSRMIQKISSIIRLPHLIIEGIYTHFASADHRDKTIAIRQFELFRNLLDQLSRTTSFQAKIYHAANSAAIIDMPETHMNMVRAGIALYGLYPSQEMDREKINLRPVMELKTNIQHLKKVPKGFPVSYGGTWKAPKQTTIATIPLGYADGYSRLLSSKGFMLVCGKKAPVVGRVCMDLIMLDVGEIPEVCVNDEVVVFGKQNAASIAVDEIAETLGTINYEIVSTISSRVPRIFNG
ncbi:MAG: alanine racemase [Pseudomonadota bacterium]